MKFSAAVHKECCCL